VGNIAERKGCGLVAPAEQDFFALLDFDCVADMAVLFGRGNFRHNRLPVKKSFQILWMLNYKPGFHILAITHNYYFSGVTGVGNSRSLVVAEMAGVDSTSGKDTGSLA
jgi:hypothetical protein